jgi:hypothetical protein
MTGRRSPGCRPSSHSTNLPGQYTCRPRRPGAVGRRARSTTESVRGGGRKARRGNGIPSDRVQRLPPTRSSTNRRAAERWSTRSAATSRRAVRSRRSSSVVPVYGGLATTRNGRAGQCTAARSVSTTVTIRPGNRVRSRSARAGWSSTASTRAPASSRGAVSAPPPAPRSRTSSPGRTCAASTTRRAHASSSGCQPQARREPRGRGRGHGPAADTPHHHEEGHDVSVTVGARRLQTNCRSTASATARRGSPASSSADPTALERNARTCGGEHRGGSVTRLPRPAAVGRATALRGPPAGGGLTALHGVDLDRRHDRRAEAAGGAATWPPSASGHHSVMSGVSGSCCRQASARRARRVGLAMPRTVAILPLVMSNPTAPTTRSPSTKRMAGAPLTSA